MDDRTSKPDFTKATQSQGKPKIRDKDNTAPRPTPPSGVTRPAPNLAPSGMMGIRTGLHQGQSTQPAAQVRQTITSVNDNRPDQGQWTDGKILTMDGYTFNAKLSEEPSAKGIDGGKITELDVRKDGVTVMRYNQGWDAKPKTAEQREALHRIRGGLGDTPQKEFKGFDRGGDKDHRFER